MEPFGDEWRQTGMLCAELHNSQRTGNKTPILGPADFVNLPGDKKPKQDEPPQTPEQVTLVFRRIGVQVVESG